MRSASDERNFSNADLLVATSTWPTNLIPNIRVALNVHFPAAALDARCLAALQQVVLARQQYGVPVNGALLVDAMVMFSGRVCG